jgi:LPS export ABC transporter permease LptF
MFLKKIDGYILKNTARLAIFYTLVPTLILWIVQSRKIFELALGSGTSAWVVLKLSSYLIPPILPHILPFSVILATITILVRLYNDSELAILWTAGISPARLMRSFIILGLITMCIILIINLFIAPHISRQLKIELFNVKNDIIQSALKPGIIQNPQKDITLYIDAINGNSYIEGFYLAQKDNNQMRIFTAKQALLQENDDDFQLLLLKGRILNWSYARNDTLKSDKNNPEIYPTLLEFDKFTLNISDIIATINNSQDLQFKARDYSISDLLTAKYAKTPQEKNRFIVMGHAQIMASFFPMIFILCAIVIMLRPMPPRGFPHILILMPIAICVLFRLLSSLLQNLSDDNLNYIYASYIVHISSILFMLLFMLTKKRAT